jgi:hypothetical protein
MAMKSGRMVGALFHVTVFSIDFLFSWSSISLKNDEAKRLGLFDVRKVPKT